MRFVLLIVLNFTLIVKIYVSNEQPDGVSYSHAKSDTPKYYQDEIYESRVSKMCFSGLANAISVFVTHPMNVIKFSLQLKPLSLVEILSFHFLKTPGTVYKGITGVMCRTMIYGNIRFELYEMAKRFGLVNTFQDKIKISAITGALGGFLVTPITRVNYRTHNDELLSPNRRFYYKGVVNGMYRIYLEEGFHMLFRGATMATVRGMMGTIGQIALYDELKSRLTNNHPGHFKDSFATYLLASVTAGLAASLFQHPFDVISTKQLSNPAGKILKTSAIVRSIVRHHGPAGFFKGVLPTLARIVSQTVLTYMILENLSDQFGVLMRTRKRGETYELIDIDEKTCPPDDEECLRREVERRDSLKKQKTTEKSQLDASNETDDTKVKFGSDFMQYIAKCILSQIKKNDE